jgi:hypothetical protein
MQGKPLLLTLALLAYTQLGICQNRVLGFVLEPGRKRVQIPFELQNNLIVVPVVVNGMLPLRFILDTGVQTAILTEKAFADILNLQYTRKYTISAPGAEKSVNAFVTNNVTLEMPGIRGMGHALLVLEEDYLELRNYLGTDVHGILGYELFSRFIIEINYERKIMTISTPARYRHGRNFETLRMTVEDTKPYINATVTLTNGAHLNAKMLVDSGASHGMLLDAGSDSLIVVPNNFVSSQIGRGIGGAITGKVGRIKSIELGKYELSNAIVNFPDPNSYMDSLKLGSTKRNGTIGGEILSRFTVVFNFPKEEIYIKKNTSFKKKFYYNLSGLVVKAKGSRLDVFEITEVRGESAAEEADILVGDNILAVNGISAKSLNLNQITGYLNSKPGRRITLELQRDGQILKRRLVLADQI